VATLHLCDVCGEEFKPKEGCGGMMIAVKPPRESAIEKSRKNTAPRTLQEMLGMEPPPSAEEQHVFDLCYACVLAVAVNFKKIKADHRAGRRGVCA
jgi:hypothetical protein